MRVVLNDPVDRFAYNLLRICAGMVCDRRKLRFLLGGEVYFHADSLGTLDPQCQPSLFAQAGYIDEGMCYNRGLT